MKMVLSLFDNLDEECNEFMVCIDHLRCDLSVYVDRNNIIIYYNPNNPNEYYLDKKVSNNLSLVFGIVGIVLLSVGSLFILIDLLIF